MPRDSNGNYTLPSGNPVVPGTIISSDWANPTLQDIANELTQSLSRTGEGGMLVPLTFADGSVVQPGIAWTNEVRTGFYRAGVNDMRVSVNGIDVFRWIPGAIEVWDINQSVWRPIEVGFQTAEETPYNSVTYNNVQQGLDAALTAVGTLFTSTEFTNVQDALVAALTAIGTFYNSADSNLNSDNVKDALDELNTKIEQLSSQFRFRGTWDALTNVPDIAIDPDLTSGDYWVVSVAGETPLDDGQGGFVTGWTVGDRAIYVSITDPLFTGWGKYESAPLDVLASQVIFDPLNYTAAGLPDPAPTQVQQALDFSWPYIFKVYDGIPAIDITYSNVTSGLAATQVQAAIDEVNNRIDTDALVQSVYGRIGAVIAVSGDYSADFVSYNNGTSGIPATEVQGAIDYINTQIVSIDYPVDSVFGRLGSVVALASDYDAVQVDFSNALTPTWAAIEVQSALENAYAQIQFLAGSIVLKGVWDALANVPNLITEIKISGNYWICNVEGSTVLPLYPGAPAHVLPWLVYDRVLWLDDGDGNTGFAQLRSEAGDYLLLTGGTMLGDINLSNGLSVNTVTTNADGGNIGKTTLPTISSDLNDVIVTGFFRPSSGAINNPDGTDGQLLNMSGGASGDVQGQLFISAQTKDVYTRGKYGSWSAWEKIAKSTDLALYLPLTGGELSAPLTIDHDGTPLILKSATAGGGSFITFTTDLAAQRGYVGFASPGSDTLAINATLGAIRMDTPTTLTINAPIMNINGSVNVITDGPGLTLKQDQIDVPIIARFQSELGVGIGYIGKQDFISHDMYIVAEANNRLILESASAIDLNAPTVIISGETLLPSLSGGSIRASGGVSLFLGGGYPDLNLIAIQFRNNIFDSIGFFDGNGNFIAEGQSRAVAPVPIGASDLTRKDYVDGLVGSPDTSGADWWQNSDTKWVNQFGSEVMTSGAILTVTMQKVMASAAYGLTISVGSNNDNTTNPITYAQTATNFVIINGSSTTQTINWAVMGLGV